MNSKTRQLVDHAVPMHFPPGVTLNGNELITTKPMECTSKQRSAVSFEACCVSGCSTKFDSADNSVIGLRYISLHIN